MSTTLKKKMDALYPARRRKVEARAAQLVAEELSLRDLRHAHQRTQEEVGGSLGIGQEGVSRLEKRSDLLLSTLRSYVEAMGGHLRLIAEFPRRPPVVLGGLAAIDGVNASPSRPRGKGKVRRASRTGQGSRGRRA